MKLTGPEAMPPPDNLAREERNVEKLVPVPDPYLNSRPSVAARFKIESIVSSTELMKQAEHCGFFSIPQLNQTGELNEAYWFKSKYDSSS
jgi:hypothetical protein